MRCTVRDLDRKELCGRDRGIGWALVAESLRWFAVHGARQVSVVTQGRNVQAQRLYQHCGFLTRSMQL